MTPSRSIINSIKSSEGLVLHTYADIAGVLTIGYGSTRYKDGTKPVMGQTITEPKAYDLLAWEVALKADAVNALVKGLPLNQNQFDALVDFAYNLGVGALAGSTLLILIKASVNNPVIKKEFLKWNKAKVNGKLVEVAGLTKRRQAESDLYFTPIN